MINPSYEYDSHATRVGGHVFTEYENIALSHLVRTAVRKPYYAYLLTNMADMGYNCCDLKRCIFYLRGEEDSKLQDAVFLIIQLAAKGITTDKYIDFDVILGIAEYHHIEEMEFNY